VPVAERPLLILPGYATEHEVELRERARAAGVIDDVRFLSWVSPAELEGIWALVRAFVFPSLYEGFGLPVLEAMARGVPVACSNASSLPEVAGEAALLFDPGDEAAIATALQRLLREQELCAGLRERGLARAREFTWERTAQGCLESYARVLGLGGVPGSWTVPVS
jgi:glycosyltransferase involved in cell wall biosynthesis